MADEQEVVQKGAAPYVSFQSIKSALRQLKEHGVPRRIDRSVLTSFSGSVAGQILTAFKFLGLTDADNQPTQSMKALTEAIDDEKAWPEALATVLRSAYGSLLQHDLHSVTPSHFNELFRKSYQATEEVQRKSVTTFLSAAMEAGIPVSKYLMKKIRPRANGTAGKKKPGRPRSSGATGGASDKPPPPSDPPPPPPPAASQKPLEYQLLDLLSPDMANEQTAAVWTIITYLKSASKKT